CQQANKHPYSF
nr:immunoglobulin light chain junction region [Macaca mulatta]MOX52002.1 immunoglobulin light chain junction region [Macaca mulatta]MOX52057.1 immunoglobulin light chain junction region [Macaca mulatta]MOX52106.1 immunoglobulin light chain junction region [Macaca mulatta]MOX52187.1 immunoglobulin light chain junction region [Macaca mulatta]